MKRLVLAAATLLILTACTSKPNVQIQIDHIHGLGFTAKGGELLIAAHDGLKRYADGAWQAPEGPKHDYMGFTVTDNGFYTSGHPAPGTTLPQPLGLVQSSDLGKNLTLLGLQGKYDFHVMGAGFKSHAVYVYNQVTSPQLPAGLLYSLDEGKSWKKAGAKGLSGEPIQIAVHPSEPKIVAVGSEHGLFLSMDAGETFTKLWEKSPISAVTFRPGGDRLLFGLDGLNVYDLATKQIQALKVPPVGAKDAIGYVAIDPSKPESMALATLGMEIYLSSDGGQSWKQIAKQGKSL